MEKLQEQVVNGVPFPKWMDDVREKFSKEYSDPDLFQIVVDDLNIDFSPLYLKGHKAEVAYEYARRKYELDLFEDMIYNT